jgi:quercetin dioxygenase-like cupin family protein
VHALTMVRAGRRQLEGVVTVTVDGPKQLLGPGEAVFIARGSVHHHENQHECRTPTLAVMTSGTIGRPYFEEMAELINVPGKPGLAKA